MSRRFIFNNIEEEIKKKTLDWFHLANTWRVIDYILGILPFLVSITVVFLEAVFPTEDLKCAVIILSTVAALISLTCFVIEPKKHMRNYRKAFFEGYKCIFRNDTNSIKQAEYLDALSTGEKTIGTTYDIEEYTAIDEKTDRVLKESMDKYKKYQLQSLNNVNQS